MPRSQGIITGQALCPVHGVQLLVGRTVGALQYRYCTVTGCHESARTKRKLNPEQRAELVGRKGEHE